MAKIGELSLTDNGTVSVKCKNTKTGIAASYTTILTGDFGGGTITVGVSIDGGSTYVTTIDDGSTITFTDDAAENFRINSDENDPVYLGFTLAGASSPDITIKVYDER